jgi:hypothetical protein
MVLLEISPFEVHFGDPNYEKKWDNCNSFTVPLVISFVTKGIVDPIVVYSVDRDNLLKKRLLDTGIENPTGLFCWRGTQRLRMARFLNLPKIKALLLDEPIDVNINVAEIQKYYKKPIRVFSNNELQRWDVMGIAEDGGLITQIIY